MAEVGSGVTSIAGAEADVVDGSVVVAAPDSAVGATTAPTGFIDLRSLASCSSSFFAAFPSAFRNFSSSLSCSTVD